jgi:hypothetical protein
MNAHTPGPWRIEESSHKQEFSHWIASISRHVMPRQSTIAGVVNAGGESDGNAALIAAAPELLAACKAMLLDRTRDDHTSRIAAAAIAKAEGRTS